VTAQPSNRSDNALESSFFGERDSSAEAANDSLSALTARVHGVKPFPLSAHRVIAAATNPATSTQEIAGILEMDPGLAARVLRLVNSAGFGVAGKCKTVAHAVALLGPVRVAEVATTAVVLDLFGEDSAHVKHVLDHSVGVAAVARRLAQRFDLRADDVFTCALLHDIGKMMMLEEPGYEELLAEEHDHPDETVVRERERYGFDHAVLAGMLLTKWKLPRPIPEVVAWHHSPTLAYEASPAVATTVHLLRLADVLVHRLGKQPPSPALLESIAHGEDATALELTAEDLERSWADLHRTLCRARGASEQDDGLAVPTAAPEPLAMPMSAEAAESACEVCGVTTFGQSCPRCQKPLCALHAPAGHTCCASCEQEFESATRSDTLRMKKSGTVALIALSCSLVTFVLHRVMSEQHTGPLLWFGVLLFSAACLFASIALALRWRMRARFFSA
jgi:putative nucleotidyltransferase with HDIG domain